VKRPGLLKVIVAAALAAAALSSQAQVFVGTSIGWGWPGSSPYWPYPSTWNGPWVPCGFGACADSPYLRRAIQRELARLEYLGELDERNQRGLQRYAQAPYVNRRDLPPPTPEDQVQPAYRRSGEIRPEFGASGQARR
jgi:hypothetical protein